MRLSIRGHYLLQQIPPAVLLVRGDGDVQRVSVREAVALVDETSGEVEEIPGFQHHLQDRRPNFCLIKVCWKTKRFALRKRRLEQGGQLCGSSNLEKASWDKTAEPALWGTEKKKDAANPVIASWTYSLKAQARPHLLSWKKITEEQFHGCSLATKPPQLFILGCFKCPPSILPWVVHSPVLLSLQLYDKRLNVVVMRSKALCPGWSQVSWLGQEIGKWAIGRQRKTGTTTTVLSCLHVGSRHAAELLLKDGEHVPHSGGESLGVQHADGAATLGNGGGRKCAITESQHAKLTAQGEEYQKAQVTL